jgi:TatD DNase family protein
LVETDAPFLTPTPFRGRPNAPYLIPLTLRFMAGHLGVEVDELSADIARNTEQVYGAW